jgi:hypothetical protein
MDANGKLSGPQLLADRPTEQPAVRTTIVGGRPPGSGQPLGDIPRGIEVLVKKAAVDAQFKQLLLADRVAAAESIGLKLEPAEAAMLASIPAEQLEAVIARTTVPEHHRRVFLGAAATAMLAALGVKVAADVAVQVIERQAMGPKPGTAPPPAIERPRAGPAPTGSRPDMPPERPPRDEPTKGIRPDRPPPKEP